MPLICGPERSTLGPDQWQVLIELHGTLVHEHHDLSMLIQHPGGTSESKLFLLLSLVLVIVCIPVFPFLHPDILFHSCPASTSRISTSLVWNENAKRVVLVSCQACRDACCSRSMVQSLQRTDADSDAFHRQLYGQDVGFVGRSECAKSLHWRCVRAIWRSVLTHDA